MKPFELLIILCSVYVYVVSAQYEEERAPRYVSSDSEPKPTPVSILKQINRHNEDGSYTYGYEAADGSFKIETKSPTGEVKGKYGYKDDTGKVRVIEYGANKYGFQPAGEGITVAPPTLVDETTGRNEELRPKPQKSQYRPPPPPRPSPSQDYDYEDSPPQPAYRAPPTPRPAPAYRAPAAAAPRPPKPAFFAGAAPAPQEQETFFRPAPPQPPQQQFRQETQAQFRPQKPDFRSTQSFQRPNQGPQQFNQQPSIEYQDFSGNNFQSQPRYTNNVIPKAPKANQGFSMLDQLLKEFALPQGNSVPLHDITFGSY